MSEKRKSLQWSLGVKVLLQGSARGQMAVVRLCGIGLSALKELGKAGNISLERRVWLFG